MKRLILVVFLLLLAACDASRIGGDAAPSPASHSLPLTLTPKETTSPSPTVTDTPAASSIAVSVTTRTPLPTLEPDQPIFITTLHMMDAAAGWATDSSNHLLRTMDGGNTWQEVTPPEGGFFTFIDAAHAWAVVPAQIPCKESGCQPVSGTVLWQTSDGGQTWQRGVPFDPGVPYYQPIAMQFIGDHSGWFLFVNMIGMSHSTYETLLRTLDGGVAWMETRGGTSSLCISGGMVFLNELDGWIGSDCRWNMNAVEGTRLQDFIRGQAAPVLKRTYDGGDTWPDYSILPPPEEFPPILTSPDADGDTQIWCGITKMKRVSGETFTLRWSCSHYFPDPPIEIFNFGYLTPDAGRSWHSWLATGNEEFIDALTGWRLHPPGEGPSGQLQQSSDGGLTWTTIKTVAWQSAQFDFVSERVGWAIVTNDDAASLVYTTNGGSSWVELDPIIVP